MGKPALRVMEESTLQPSVNQKLFADAVHSIKNSLGGIAGFAALLDRDLDSEDPKKRLTQRIQDGVMRVNDMVVSLMLLARELELTHEKIPLRSLVGDVWRNYWSSRDEEEPDTLSHSDFSANPVEIVADIRLIQQMVHHAIRFVDLVGKGFRSILIMPHPEERVDLEFAFTNRTLSVGSTEEMQELIQRCEPVEARLSLAIVHKITKIHGGQVTLTSFSKQHKVLTLEFMKGC